MRGAALPRQAAQLLAVSLAAARAYRTSPVQAARRARALRRAQHYDYREALGEGLLDPRMPEDQRALHGSRHATLLLQRTLNSESFAPIAGEKAVFYRYCEAVGLPTPRLFGIVDPAASGWSHTGLPVVGAEGFARFVREDLPDAWVIKPSAGYHGRGVRVLRRRGDVLTDSGGRTLTPAALHAELAADREFGAWVVQELLGNHPDLARLIDAPTLQTLRLVTLVDRAGGVDLLYGVLRIAVAGGATDNFLAGESGNGLANVSTADGTLEWVRLARPGGLGFVRAQELPGSGIRVAGMQLPDWEETASLVRRAALLFLPARALGWDVALTPDGPVIVEANMFWWPRSGPEQGALAERMRSA